jgi:hypothetical protein
MEIFALQQEDLVFKMELSDKSTFFKQTNGLAMGVPAAPDIAQFFAGHYENKFSEHREFEQCFKLFYRYMDDIFSILFARSLSHADWLLREHVKYPGLEINWDISEIKATFLDISLWRSPNAPLSPIRYKPFRKSGNNFERLPWITGHSEKILKAAFKSEVYRMATNSYCSSVFDEEMDWISKLYVNRGYPPKIILSWIKRFKATAFARRLQIRASSDSKEEDEGVWVLKGEMNPAWENVVLSTVSDAMIESWLNSGLDADAVKLVNRRLVSSLKRPQNLGDMSNAHNRKVLKIKKDTELLTIAPVQLSEPVRRNKGNALYLDDSSSSEMEE